jgi:hypothetical protein
MGDPTNLGNILLRMGCLDAEQLRAAVLEQMAISTPRRLGDVLLDMEALTPADLDTALEVQRLLRAKDRLGASMAYQTRRMSRSVDRQFAGVTRALAALDPTHRVA